MFGNGSGRQGAAGWPAVAGVSLALALAGAGPAQAGGTGCAPAAPCQGAANSPPPLPRGHVPVWDDGRLNPHRGKGSAEGDAAMARLWTNAVPMTLVTGR